MSDAHAAARVLGAARRPLRFEDIRSRLREAGLNLSVKQARRSLEVAERLGLIGRVNRARWGQVDMPIVPIIRRSRADAVIDAAARLLELPASSALNRAVRSVLLLATEHGVRTGVLAPAATLPAPSPTAAFVNKSNGVQDAADQIEVRVDTHR